MALTDPIADMLTVIRNGSSSRKETVEVRSSKLAEEMMRILKDSEFISNYKVMPDNKQGILRIYLKYLKSGTPGILGIRQISKSGLRVYKRCDELPKIYGGLGIAIISTSKGLLTDDQARERKIGGEVICHIW